MPDANHNPDAKDLYHEVLESRRVIAQLSATTALEYAGLVVAMAILMGTILPSMGSIGDKNLYWILEGILALGVLHGVLNSSYYGSLAGFAIRSKPSEGIDREDPLSSLYKKYQDEVGKNRLIGKFGNVFAPKLILFILVGVVLGLLLAWA